MSPTPALLFPSSSASTCVRVCAQKKPWLFVSFFFPWMIFSAWYLGGHQEPRQGLSLSCVRLDSNRLFFFNFSPRTGFISLSILPPPPLLPPSSTPLFFDLFLFNRFLLSSRTAGLGSVAIHLSHHPLPGFLPWSRVCDSANQVTVPVDGHSFCFRAPSLYFVKSGNICISSCSVSRLWYSRHRLPVYFRRLLSFRIWHRPSTARSSTFALSKKIVLFSQSISTHLIVSPF